MGPCSAQRLAVLGCGVALGTACLCRTYRKMLGTLLQLPARIRMTFCHPVWEGCTASTTPLLSLKFWGTFFLKSMAARIKTDSWIKAVAVRLPLITRNV